MSILSACQSAAIRLLGRKPTTIFSSQKKLELQLSDLVQEAAIDIAKAFEWQALLTLGEHSGNGALTAFPLPSDFDRMPIKGNVHSATWQQSGYRPVRDRDEWLYLQTSLSAGAPGAWIILDGKMQIFPAMGPSEKARYYYLTKNIFKAADGTLKAEATKDDDTFRLDERLLTLSLIWRYRDQAGLDYSEAMASYGRALAQAGGKDKSDRPMAIGPARLPYDADIAFPGVIVP